MAIDCIPELLWVGTIIGHLGRVVDDQLLREEVRFGECQKDEVLDDLQ